MLDDVIVRLKGGSSVRTGVTVPIIMPTSGEIVPACLTTFDGLWDKREHIALLFGEETEAVPWVRVHSECLTGDVFGSRRCDCGPQLDESLSVLSRCGGALLYLRQEGRGIGLYNKMDAYRLQDEGLDTFAANRALGLADDMRDYRVAGQMLGALGITRIRLMTNNPLKVRKIRNAGVKIEEVVPTGVFLTQSNERYLTAKAKKAGHRIDLAGKAL